tara:strand:- start:189 stop:422 length:234 start_codon:yes stop_codon:yes gene_type:complete
MKYLITMLMVLTIPNIAVADGHNLYYTDEDKYWEIFGNCVIDLMPENANSSLESQINEKCARIARNPSTWQKWKYSD